MLNRNSGHLRRYDVAFYVPEVSALLARTDGPPPGGGETQVLLVARALAARGVRVCLCVYDVAGVEIPAKLDGVELVFRPPFVAGRGIGGRVREVCEIARGIRELDADVVVTRIAGVRVGLVGFFSRLSGRRFVYSSASLMDFDFATFLGSRRDRLFYRLGIRLANAIVVQTDEQVRLCLSRFGRMPIVIRNVAERAAARTGRPEAFLWIGRIDPNKRPLEYVRLARALPHAMFWMVAIPHDLSLMNAVTDAAATTPNLELLAPRPRAEVLELIDRAVAVVSTSEVEGMPNVFLEGWARGVPALALAHDPDGVIEGRGLGGVGCGSAEVLAQAARRVWADRDDQGEVAGRCRRYIEDEHAADVVAHQWESALGVSWRACRSLPRVEVAEC